MHNFWGLRSQDQISRMEESMSNGTKVVKRNGALEPLNLDKLHVMVEASCEEIGRAHV